MQRTRVLVLGGNGFLGGFVRREFAGAFDVVSAARTGGDRLCDLTDGVAVEALLAEVRPDFVLNLAAASRMAACEADPEAARRANAEAPERLARALGPRLLHVSTDLVFDGRGAPYRALDPTGPLSAYGSTKADGEERVLAHGGRVVRLPLLFGPDALGRGASAMVTKAIAEQRIVALFPNEYRTPLHAMDAARALLALLPRTDLKRVVHVAGPERVSRWEFGRLLCAALSLSDRWLVAVECIDPLRPRDVSLVSDFAQRSLVEMLREA